MLKLVKIKFKAKKSSGESTKEVRKRLFFLDTFILDGRVSFLSFFLPRQPFFLSFLFFLSPPCCLSSDACCVCRLRNRCHQAQLEWRRNNDRRRENLMLFGSPPPLSHPPTQSKPPYYTHAQTAIYP